MLDLTYYASEFYWIMGDDRDEDSKSRTLSSCICNFDFQALDRVLVEAVGEKREEKCRDLKLVLSPVENLSASAFKIAPYTRNRGLRICD